MRADDPHAAAAAFSRGAVDLSALKAGPAPASPSGGGGPRPDGEAAGPPNGSAGGVTIIDVTEATFQSEVLERSLHTPVVIDFWAEWCGPCKQLSPILEKLAVEGAGRWVLAKIDVDANQRIASAFRVQSIPTVYAVIGGQPVDAFMGVIPETQLRQWIDALMQAAQQAGLQGGDAADGQAAQAGEGAEGAEGAEPAEPELPDDPATDALADGDLDKAEELYNRALAENPADGSAEAGLAQVRLLRRTEGLDPDQVIAEAAQRPEDVESQSRAADVEVLSGLAERGYARLVELVRRTSGEERDAARAHLISLFAMADPDDPAVAQARRDLANALF
ncbi:MAG: thioredoxin [Micromonosporaceae bacterium]|nr:thioredoxin [Micromonosporaceae bacterium]